MIKNFFHCMQGLLKTRRRKHSEPENCHININHRRFCGLVSSMVESRKLFRHPTAVFLPGASQGQRSLVGCHLWGRTESDTTEAT